MHATPERGDSSGKGGRNRQNTVYKAKGSIWQELILNQESKVTDYTPYQQKIIKRYYDQQDVIQLRRLAELVSELFLAEGKKLTRAWQAAGVTMQKLGLPQAQIDHLLKQAKPALIAEVVKELESKKPNK
jgi:hypothetical protein